MYRGDKRGGDDIKEKRSERVKGGNERGEKETNMERRRKKKERRMRGCQVSIQQRQRKVSSINDDLHH